MRISINQPAYHPWPGYFARIACSDKHVMLDHVQFEKNSLINRNKIRTAQGWSWLTVPVKTKGKFQALSIDSVEIDNTRNWQTKQWKTICQNYRKAPFFERHAAWLEPFYIQRYDKLSYLLKELNSEYLNQLNIRTTTVNSSSLTLNMNKSDLVLEICKKMGATEYLSGPLGRNYLDLASFEKDNIRVLFHEYTPPIYTQIFDPYISHMSTLDLLMMQGDSAYSLLMMDNNL